MDALKEWATVVKALENGEQTVILRKGGILETASGFNVEAKAKEIVPVDTSATKNSIWPDFDNLRNLEVRIGPTTDYAPFVEFGTSRQRAQPFMIPAIEAEGPRLAQAVVEMFRRG